MALGSAASFGTLPILAKLAYADGMQVAQLLSLRFTLSTFVGLGLCVITRSSPLRVAPSVLGVLVILGAGFYGVESFLFFTSLVYLPASLVELLLYLYPTFVLGAGALFLGRSVPRRLWAAMAASLIGVALLSGGVEGHGGIALALGLLVPIGYAAYLMTADWVMRSTSTIAASTVVFAGASCFWVVVALSRGQFAPPPDARAAEILGLLVLGPSLLGISLVLGAVRRIGSPSVSLLSTFEPLVTVVLAFAVLGERLLTLQVVGGVLILAAIVAIQLATKAVDSTTASA